MPEPNENPLGIIEAKPKHGDEPFHLGGKAVGFDLLSYWRWTASDLLNNTSRGNLAEFIIGQALGVPAPVRATWDDYDLLTEDGVRIEVKSSAYIQGWGQKKHSRPNFGIGPSRAWEKEQAGRAASAARHSDVYVFALLHHKDQPTVDPTDLSQWTFFVLPTRVLDEELPAQKNISLNPLRWLGAVETDFAGLRDAVNYASRPAS